MFTKVLIFISVISCHFCSYAKDVNILTITSTDDNNIYRIGLMINQKTGLAKGFYKREFTPKGELVKDPSLHKEFSIEELGRGVVLVSRPVCSNVVSLKSQSMNLEVGATIRLSVVKNCLVNSYKHKELEVSRVSSDRYMVSYENQVISNDQKLHFQVGMFGIKAIKVQRNNYRNLFD